MLKKEDKKMSKYAVIDLEMCRINRTFEKIPYPCKSEIIQIGAVLLNNSFEVTEKFMSYVSPAYGIVDSYIESLTGITRKNTNSAPDLKDALEAFTSWLPDDATIVTWSENDEAQLRKEMAAKRIVIPKLGDMLSSYVDCQVIFGEKMNSPKVYSLSEALTITDINYEDGAHDALVDAYNTALLFAKLQNEENLTLNRYYYSEGKDEHLSSNPFAELLKDF